MHRVGTASPVPPSWRTYHVTSVRLCPGPCRRCRSPRRRAGPRDGRDRSGADGRRRERRRVRTGPRVAAIGARLAVGLPVRRALGVGRVFSVPLLVLRVRARLLLVLLVPPVRVLRLLRRVRPPVLLRVLHS